MRTLVLIALLMPAGLAAQYPEASFDGKQFTFGVAIAVGVGYAIDDQTAALVNTATWLAYEISNCRAHTAYHRCHWIPKNTGDLAAGIAGGLVGLGLKRVLTHWILGGEG